MRYVIHAIAAAIASLAGTSHAADNDFSTLASMFGTIGATQTNTDQAQYAFPGQPKGADKSASLKPDTKVGAQLDVNFDATFSATAQALSRYSFKGNWKPEIEWAFAKAKLPASLSVRAGRMGAPFFMVSDFRMVGYANTWIRPPQEVYGQVNFSNFDGADLLFKDSIGDVAINAQIFGGKTKIFFVDSDMKLNNMVGVNASAEVGPVTVRLGHVQAKLNWQGLDPLLIGLRAASANPGLGHLAALADDLSLENKRATFSGIGVSYDSGSLLASAEYTKRRIDGAFADTTGWYTTVGYREGKWVPYLTLSRLKQDSATSSDAVPNAGPLVPLYQGVNTVLRSVGQKSTSIGIRWDVLKGVAIKGQVDRIKTDEGGSGLFRDAQPGFTGQTVNVYGVAVDFIW